MLVMGEDHEWEMIEYAKHAIDVAEPSIAIVVSDIASEQAGGPGRSHAVDEDFH